MPGKPVAKSIGIQISRPNIRKFGEKLVTNGGIASSDNKGYKLRKGNTGISEFGIPDYRSNFGINIDIDVGQYRTSDIDNIRSSARCLSFKYCSASLSSQWLAQLLSHVNSVSIICLYYLSLLHPPPPPPCTALLTVLHSACFTVLI